MTSGWNEFPIILLGRGGSGTRLLSNLALDAGVFLGNKLNKSLDSEEWVELVYQMVQENPSSLSLPTGNQYRSKIIDCAQGIIEQAGEAKSRIWGFKLPELMLVLPYFIDAFPEAKVLHLVRHPIATCVRRSHMTSRLKNPIGDVVLPLAYQYAGKDPAEITQDETHLHNAYSWDFQVSRLIDYGRKVLGPRQYFEAKYENIVDNPNDMLKEIASFWGIVEPVKNTTLKIDIQRIKSIDMRSHEARQVCNICGNTARLLGYGECATS